VLGFTFLRYSPVVTIGMILFEGMTQLDLTGPLEVFSRLSDTKIHLVSKTKDPVRSDRGLTIIPDTTFNDCPEELTVIFVPGGPGVSRVLADDEYIDFIRSRGKAAFITSVCTGSIILAACGLLDGFKATTHWLSLDLLRRFNVETQNSRVVIDRNRITGGGVTSGIDFALTIASILFDDQVAKELQLLIEYNPQPPFLSGHPDVADESMVAKVKAERTEMQKKRLEEIDSFILKHQIT
jgi:cyclohexyl-isocyanide hydratase